MSQKFFARPSMWFACALLLSCARQASAETFIFVWDLNPESAVTGYLVHIGTTRGVYTQTVDVGMTDQYVLADPVPGQQYCFAVTAYADGLASPPSSEVCGSSGVPPYLNQPPAQAGLVGQPATLQLDGGHAGGAAVTYSATGLPPGLLLTQSLGLISGVPTLAGAYTVRATVTANGLSVSRSFGWTVEASNEPPSLVSPGAQTSDVGQSVTLQLQGSDPDGQPLAYSATGLPAGLTISSGGRISGTPTTAGTYNVTASVSDGALSASRTFTWTIRQSNRAPSLTNPGNQTTQVQTAVMLQLEASDADADTLSYVASGLPAGLQLSRTTGAISGAPTQSATYNVSVTVSDGALSATQTFTWTVRTTNAAPTVSSPGNQSSSVGAFVILDVQASDADGDSLTFSATGLPPGLAIGATSGRIAGTPTAAGTYQVTVTANDGTVSSSASFTWTVVEPNSAPVLTTPADRTSDVDVAATLQLQATDANGDALTYSALGLPPGLSIGASTGLIAGTPTLAGVFSVSVSVSDGAAQATASFSWTVQEASSGTNLSLVNPGTQRHNVGQTVLLELRSNSSGPLTFSAINLPPGLVLDAATGRITGTPSTPGTYIVTVSVTDGTTTVTKGFTWVIRRSNGAPVLTNPGPLTHSVGDAVVLQLEASDPNGDTLTYSATGLPTGLQLDAATGRIAGFPSTAGSYSVTTTVSDGTLSAVQTFIWTIVASNAAPTLAAPGNQTSTAGQPASLQLQGADADGDTLSYSATGLPPGLQLGAATGLIAGTPATPGSYSVSVTVSDGKLSANRIFTWTVLAPNTAPTLAAPSNQTSIVGEPAALQLQAADTDGDSLVYAATGLPPGLHVNAGSGRIAGTPTTAGTYIVTASVSDGALSVSRMLTWTVAHPNVAPTLAAPGDQSTAVGQAVLLQLRGADENGDPLTYSATGLPFGLLLNAGTGRIAGTPTTSGTYNVTATVSDGTFSASRSFTWRITSANVAPLLSTPAAQSTMEGAAAILDILATDPNGDTLTYTATGLPPGLQMNSSIGRISGIPTVPGTYSVAVVVSDGRLDTQRSFVWTIVPRPPAAAPAPTQPLPTRASASAVYTGTAASARPAPSTQPDQVRQYSGAASARPGGTTAPVTPVKEYTGTAALTRPAAPAVAADEAAYTGTAVQTGAGPVVSDRSETLQVKNSTLQSATTTRSAATRQMTSGGASTETALTETSLTATTATAVSAPRGAPSVSIDTPVDHARFAAGATVIFSGHAYDAQDGTLSHTIIWTSSLDGKIGAGAMFTRVLSTGTHTVTARAIDSNGNTRTAQVMVTVE